MAEKLDMKSMDITQENISKIQTLFPSAVTEVMGEDGKVKLAIDFDVLKQELSADLISEKQERYQMTWPDKSKAKVLANSRITATLRPDKEKSVDFDNTQNLYIEGDNLDVLKLLRETYLGKVKMIYIDPPYNTGNDFVYEDDFAMSAEDYSEISGQYDEQGNRLVKNLDSNGRFHTDWLNMIYPRLKIARDLLTDDGVIFISIDENESANLKKICDEIYGNQNFFGELIWEATTQPINAGSAKFGLQKKTETILLYGKNKSSIYGFCLEEIENGLSYPHIGKFGACRFEIIEKSDAGGYSRPTMKFAILGQYPREGKRWQIGEDTARQLEKEGKVEIVDGVVKKAVYPEDEMDKKQYNPFWSLLTSKDVGTAQNGKDELNKILETQVGFDTVKPTQLIKKLLSYIGKNYIVADFFSGTATTAHAVMQLNAEDGGNRKYIMVQLPELCSENSTAYKAGYKTICDIGEERIRRAGKKIQSEVLSVKSGVEGQMSIDNSTLQTPNSTLQTPHSKLDIGFRVLKLDSSNMQEVYYNPSAMTQDMLSATVDNVKMDRTPLDLLFQVMLDLGIELSAKIDEHTVNGKTYYAVNDNDIIACFDDDIDNDVITAIAKQFPLYAVFKDKSFATDSVGINNEQLFKTYSPSTVVKVI